MPDSPARPTAPAADDRCPCGSGDTFGACCGPFLNGADAPTAAQLMRSRYTAYAIGDARYVLATWHPSTRPAELDLDPDLTWRSLHLIATERGGPFDTEGTVEFVAAWRDAEGGRGRLHEVSRFRRADRRWTYVDGDVD